MPPIFHHFVTPKHGSAKRECEDAFSITRSSLRAAVADGASDSFDSRFWARLLALEWRRNANFEPEAAAQNIANLGLRWKAKWDKDLPWYAEAKAKRGAFAAFIGVALEGAGWRALSVGDCCLFVLGRDSKLIQSFPLTHSAEFGTNPFLIGSTVQDGLLNRFQIASGELASDQRLLLMSDAIACWFMGNFEENRPGNDRLEDLLLARDHAGLTALVEEERAGGRLRNDDIAIIRVAI